MRHPILKKGICLVILISVMVLLFAVGTMIGATAPVSAASIKRTGAATSSAKTTTVVPTDIKINTTPEKSTAYGPNGAHYDECDQGGTHCYNYDDEGYWTYHFGNSKEVQRSNYTYWSEAGQEGNDEGNHGGSSQGNSHSSS
ncbi:hypothetical protein [Ktedonobacter racemifer]|uniref:hypothetical protein n=1 Tax=Ktedonobacter racemifer TaxID=363277 RepID=UPI0012F92528|nr:hypothetical protein [Ktedonobacter racemifer]